MRLSPSLRQKKRYIVFKIDSDTSFSSDQVKKAIIEALLQFLGEFGVAKAAPQFLKEKYKNNQFVLKVNHKYVDECISAVILIRTIINKPVILKSIITFGTLKKAISYM